MPTHTTMRALLLLAILLAPPRVLILGDSLARGAFATSPASTYAGRVAVALGAVETTLVPPGRDLASAEAARATHGARGWDLVVLEVGINDTFDGATTPAWAARYAALVTNIAATGATVICVTPFDVGVAAVADDLAARAAAIRASCPGGRVADAYARTQGRPELRARVGDPTFYAASAADDLHPNDAGHAVVATAVLAAIRPHRIALPLLAAPPRASR